LIVGQNLIDSRSFRSAADFDFQMAAESNNARSGNRSRQTR
jgi:hypothetical protein